MQVINQSTISTKTIKVILKDLGVMTNAQYTLAVCMDSDLDDLGKCVKVGDILVVWLKSDDISVLAHELKHVEQVVAGLYEFVVTEQAITDYDDQWHEIEANEYAMKYAA